MANLERRGGSRPTRSQRAQRAYQLTLATGGLAVAGVVLFVLGLVGIGSAFLGVVVLALAALCFFLLRRTMGM